MSLTGVATNFGKANLPPPPSPKHRHAHTHIHAQHTPPHIYTHACVHVSADVFIAMTIACDDSLSQFK